MPVVMLERGPWRTRETFGGDELANVNRYNLWPDPLLNPRTVRDSIDGEFRTELFCPVQQMVGGGTALRSDLPPASAVRCSDQWLAGYQESALTRWKRLITADPTDADFVYAVWDRVQAAAPDDPATPFSG